MPDSSPSHFFTLTDYEASRCFPLPGRCLLRTSPAELKVGSVYLPEDAAEAHERVKAARVGVVVRCNERKDKYVKTQWDGEDLKSLKPGAKVVYLGHQDEMDNAYVVVRHGQILAVLEDGSEAQE